jgi:hypothetical protein
VGTSCRSFPLSLPSVLSLQLVDGYYSNSRAACCSINSPPTMPTMGRPMTAWKTPNLKSQSLLFRHGVSHTPHSLRSREHTTPMHRRQTLVFSPNTPSTATRRDFRLKYKAF